MLMLFSQLQSDVLGQPVFGKLVKLTLNPDWGTRIRSHGGIHTVWRKDYFKLRQVDLEETSVSTITKMFNRCKFQYKNINVGLQGSHGVCLLQQNSLIERRTPHLPLVMNQLIRTCQSSKVLSVQDFAQEGIGNQLMTWQSVELCHDQQQWPDFP